MLGVDIVGWGLEPRNMVVVWCCLLFCPSMTFLSGDGVSVAVHVTTHIPLS